MNAQKIMTWKDLDLLLSEKHFKSLQKNDLLKAYDIDCFSPQYEILCVLEGNFLIKINLLSPKPLGIAIYIQKKKKILINN